MECVNGQVTVLQDGMTTRYENGEQALMTVVDRREVKSVSVRDNCLFVELFSLKARPLVVFFITNRPDVALVAEKYGVDRIWVDLETLGKYYTNVICLSVMLIAISIITKRFFYVKKETSYED